MTRGPGMLAETGSMAFFRTVSFSDPLPIVEGDGIFLRAPQMADFPEWAAVREARDRKSTRLNSSH